MNPPPDFSDNSDVIRSEIEQTRHRMDETIDALGERLQGRHLLDEALHFFRIQQENGNMTKIKNKLSNSAESALHSVVDTVKSNPMPIALIGAGVAWYIYAQSRQRNRDVDYDYDDYSRGDYGDLHYASVASSPGEPEEFSSPSEGNLTEVSNQQENKGQGIKERLHEGTSELGARAQEKVRAAGERVGEIGRQVKDRSEEIYRRGRERVATTVHEHPLETGLVCLAVGLIGGLLLPTPERLRRAVAPKARELRERAQDMMNRGRQVIASGAEAAKAEARAQGISLDMRSKEGQGVSPAPEEAAAAI